MGYLRYKRPYLKIYDKIKQLFYSYPIIQFLMNVLILKPQKKEYMMVKGIMQQTLKQKEELQKSF